MKQITQFILIAIVISGCAVLPTTLSNNDIVIVTKCQWIGKMGKSTISTGVAKPVLKNVLTGQRYKVQYKKKPYTYFYSVPKGTYIVEELVLDAGQVEARMKCTELVNEFDIDEEGVYFIGGVDVIDYQTRFEHKVYDWSDFESEVQTIRNTLAANTSITDSVEVILIEDVFIRERWEK